MISRRRFLQVSASSLAGMLLGGHAIAKSWSPGTGEHFLIGEGSRGDASLFGLAPYSARPGSVRIWRNGQKEIKEIALPFFPHSFAAHPSLPHRVVTFEKWGQHLAEIDLVDMRVMRITKSEAGRRFFGHGAHSGDFIYATQMDDTGNRGIVSVLDAAEHQVVQEFETNGVFPHDCQWIPGLDTLLIVNSRSTVANNPSTENYSSLVWIDAKTGKRLKQLFIKTQEFGYAHLAQSKDGYLAVSGSFETKGNGSVPLLSVINAEGSIQRLDTLGQGHRSLQGEVLSLHLDENTGQLTATLPNSSCIQIWNYWTDTFIRQMNIAEPRGLAYSSDDRSLFISSAKSKSILRLGNDFITTTVANGLGGGGSHLLRLVI